MKATGLDVLSSRLALGSLWLMAGFLTVCGFYNIFPFVEALARSLTWQVVVALPVLVIAYTLGVVVINAASLLAVRREQRRRELQNCAIVARAGSEILATRYEALRTEAEFLRACIPTILFLAFSVIWSSLRLLSGGERWASIVAAVVVFVVTPIAALLVRRIDEKLQWLVDVTQEPQNQEPTGFELPNPPMQPPGSVIG